MPLEVFYSYAHKDEGLRDELGKQLSLLQRQGLIVGWHDRRISAGDEWRNQIDAHIRSAHIILLLVSADFLASDYCYDVEMKVALQRHAAHEAIVIPIILRPVNWSGAPFAHLQALPRDAKPITTWTNQDEAFADTARRIAEIVQRFQLAAPGTAVGPESAADRPIDGYVPKPRVLDAAIPSHIVKDRATELLVLIHLPESAGLRGALLTEEDAEAKPEDVRSKPFNVIFPLGPDGRPEPLKVMVKVTSPDFSPPAQAKNLIVPPDADSDVCEFMLTPMRTGLLKVLVELQWEDVLRGSRRLLTECVAEASSVPAEAGMNVVRMPLGVRVGNKGEAAAGEFTRLFQTHPHGPGEGLPDEPRTGSESERQGGSSVGAPAVVQYSVPSPAPVPSPPKGRVLHEPPVLGEPPPSEKAGAAPGEFTRLFQTRPHRPETGPPNESGTEAVSGEQERHPPASPSPAAQSIESSSALEARALGAAKMPPSVRVDPSVMRPSTNLKWVAAAIIAAILLALGYYWLFVYKP